MPLIRKARAGSDSHGHVWAEDGAVVEVDDADQVAALLAIPDGGFSEVTPGEGQSGNRMEPSDEPPDDPAGVDPKTEEPDTTTDDEVPEEFSEVDPKTEDTDAPKAAGRRGRKPAVKE